MENDPSATSQINDPNPISRSEYLLGILTQRRKQILGYLVQPQSTRQIIDNLFQKRWSKETVLKDLNLLEEEGLVRKLPNKAERGAAIWIRHDAAVQVILTDLSSLVETIITPKYTGIMNPNIEKPLFEMLGATFDYGKEMPKLYRNAVMAVFTTFLRSEQMFNGQTPSPPVELHVKAEINAIILFLRRMIRFLEEIAIESSWWGPTNNIRWKMFGFNPTDTNQQRQYNEMMTYWTHWSENIINGKGFASEIKE